MRVPLLVCDLRPGYGWSDDDGSNGCLGDLEAQLGSRKRLLAFPGKAVIAARRPGVATRFMVGLDASLKEPSGGHASQRPVQGAVAEHGVTVLTCEEHRDAVGVKPPSTAVRRA